MEDGRCVAPTYAVLTLLISCRYGSEFAQNGGGVFATLWDGNGVQTWFFPRASVPADITAGTPDPSTWGAPAASWPSTTCSMDEYFTDQNIIINITLCGLWYVGAPLNARTQTILRIRLLLARPITGPEPRTSMLRHVLGFAQTR